MSTISMKDTLAVHAHALCNITALTNAFIKLNDQDGQTFKLSNCQAYELLAKFAGFKSFTGLKAQTAPDSVITVEPRVYVLREYLTELFGDYTKNFRLFESRIFEYLTCQNFQLYPIHNKDYAYALAYTKVGNWHSTTRTFLELNFVDGKFTPDFMQGFTLTMLYSANLLSLYVNENESPEQFEELAESGELEDSVVAFKNAPQEVAKKLAVHSNRLGFHLFHHFTTKSFAYNRGVMFYMAKAIGAVPAVTSPSPRELMAAMTRHDAELDSIHSKIYKEMNKAALGYSNKPAYQGVADFNNSHLGYLPNFNADKKLFLNVLKNFYTLTAYFDEDVWVALDACPKEVPVIYWNEYAVSYMNAFLDYMVMFFGRFVQNKRFSLVDVYINKAGMFMFKSESPITFKHPDTKEVLSLSANDFSILMNCHISRNLVSRVMDVTVFSCYMGLALHEIAVEAVNAGKGVDNATQLSHALKSLS